MATTCIYSLNIFLIAMFQNLQWDYASRQKFLGEEPLEGPPPPGSGFSATWIG